MSGQRGADTVKNLLETPSVSWAQSVRLALESEGISATLLDEYSQGHMGFAGRVRVAVLHDADLERAQQIVARLRPPATPDPPSWRWQKLGLKLLALGFLVFIVSTGMLDPDNAGVLVYAVGAAGLVTLLAGLTMIVFGTWADKR